MIFPSTAVAAATNGLANMVLAPGPWRPSKFLLEVDTQYSPCGILSSFIAKQAEHPGCLNSNPAASNTSSRPSDFICSSTCLLPGTSQAVTFFAFCLPLM